MRNGLRSLQEAANAAFAAIRNMRFVPLEMREPPARWLVLGRRRDEHGRRVLRVADRRWFKPKEANHPNWRHNNGTSRMKRWKAGNP